MRLLPGRLRIFGSALWVFGFLHSVSPAWARLDVSFLAVGQGDSEFLVLPDGQTVLIDGGPSSSSLVSFLTSSGITAIDHVVLSHPHADHYRGLNWVFDNLTVRNFYDNRAAPAVAGEFREAEIQLFRAKVAAKQGCEIHYPVIGSELDWGAGVRVTVLNGCNEPASAMRVTNPNDCSLVLRVEHESRAVMFQGDAEKATISRMISRFGDALQSDVLKVGHHGSANATTAAWLQRVMPSEAFIEVGKNSYGHPTPTALDLLAASGATVWRTDLNGTGHIRLGN